MREFIIGMCDFCTKSTSVVRALPGSRTMAGFVVCEECDSDPDTVWPTIEELQAQKENQ